MIKGLFDIECGIDVQGDGAPVVVQSERRRGGVPGS